MSLNFLRRLPGYRRLSDALRRRYNPHAENPFLRFAPPGHFYSPLPDMQLVDRHKATLFDKTITRIPGIDINAEDQLARIAAFSQYYADIPFRDEQVSGLRYYFRNAFFSYGDAIFLYSMLRHYRPQRIIEVGAGFSSAVMLDTNDLFLSKRTTVTFVEPHPERLMALLTDDDRKLHQVIVDVVQGLPADVFTTLTENDILFIDSSHVAKTGSDVVHLVTNILPRLNAGVLVHFHDVFWPFEYPEEWVRKGIAYSESYVLKAFLQFNENFKILAFSSYLANHHREAVAQSLPLFLSHTGGSLWIQKVA